ncbi:MAG: outer membrane beta-barrel protein [Campylobacterota bacterium]|nr:outer membrane beta-barrel protein [Campylobacterota bacterium]
MKTKILSIAAATLLLSSSIFAADSFIALGYTSADIDGTSKGGVSLDMGVKFGESFKQAIGFEVAFLGEDNEMDEDAGNLGNIYYNLGYEVFEGFSPYASIGYAFQSIGNYRSSSGSTSSVYSAGLSYGAGINYEISESFDIGASYKVYNLEYLILDYSVNVANINVAYKF